MGSIQIEFSIAMVIAAVLGEAVSFLFYNHHSYWGRRFGDRYLLSAVLCDAGLVFLLHVIMRDYYSVSKWEDAATLAFVLSAIYATLEGPHFVHDHHSLSHFMGHWFHKFMILFVMIFALFHFRNY